MGILVNVLWALFFLGFPALVLFLSAKIKFLQKIGVVLICYLAGMLLGNIGVLPESFSGIQTTLQDISVVIALPLLLFTLDVKRWFRIAKTGMLCMLLAVVSIVITTTVLQLTLAGQMDDGWKLAGMASAVYTGGTPNLASMKTALHVDNSTYIQFHTYDTVISLLYIFFLSSAARPFFQKVFRLKPYKQPENMQDVDGGDISDESAGAYRKMFKPAILKWLLVALLLSAAIVGIAFVVSGLVPESYSMAVLILLVTTLSIALSFVKRVRHIKHSFQLGMYFIYVFCFAVASMTDFSILVNINWSILLYVLIAIFGSLALHALLCKLFKIDSDTFIVTSASAICSPPFVPVVVSKLKNKDLLISGLVTGIVGYAIGNYLGIGISMLFQKLFY